MNTAKEYIKTLLKLAINNNPEVLKVIRNSKTVITNATEDAQGNLHSESNGQFVSKSGVNPNYREELKQVIDKAKNNPNERQKLVIGKVSPELQEKAKENGLDISGYQHDLDVSGTRHAIKEHGQPKTEEPRGQIAITDGDFEKIPEVIYSYDDVSFTGKNKIGRETITYKKSFNDGTIMYVEEIRDKRKTLTINTMYKYKNTGNPRTFVDNNNPLSNASIYIIPDNHEDFNPYMKKHEVHNNKEQDMTLLDELKNQRIGFNLSSGFCAWCDYLARRRLTRLRVLLMCLQHLAKALHSQPARARTQVYVQIFAKTAK